MTSIVRYNISLQQSRREGKPLTLFSKQSSLEKRWRRALWAVSQKILIPPGTLESLTRLLNSQALVSICSVCHFSEPVSIYVSFLCVLVLKKSAFSLKNPQLFALGKSICVWFWLFLSFYQHLFSAPEGMSTYSSFTRRTSWLWILWISIWDSDYFSAQLPNGWLSVRNWHQILLQQRIK